VEQSLALIAELEGGMDFIKSNQIELFHDLLEQRTSANLLGYRQECGIAYYTPVLNEMRTYAQRLRMQSRGSQQSVLKYVRHS
jgi:hypothetical protein